MRIDDKNKTIWMKESVPDELMLKLKKYNYISKLVELSKISGKFGMPIAQNDRDWRDIAFAVFNGYKFESESNKEYYWRKKKEHLAWFERQENCYLAKDFIEQIKLSNLDDEGAYKYFKFTEDFALGLLKDDFDKFEKVEIKENKL